MSLSALPKPIKAKGEGPVDAITPFTLAVPQADLEDLNRRLDFLHVRSKHENALPLIITHGWPGSVIEFMKIIGPLTDPTAHGGKVEDAFHLVAPSLPGHGFSDKATERGWGIPRIAGAWITLMRRLGYTRWVAQGGDWGSVMTTAIGVMKPDDCAAIHVNMPLVFPEPDQLQWPRRVRIRASYLPDRLGRPPQLPPDAI